MSNSSLVSYTRLSPNHSGRRTHSIDRITPHCVVGQCSVETLGNVFAPTSRQASSNYGIGYDGRVGMYVEECNRSWCSSSNANDQRAVTIECASDTYAPYAFNSTVYNKLIELCVDICKRNGKNKLLWLGNASTALNYSPKSNEMVLTAHRWFASTACPGDWMYSRLGNLASEVNKRLGGGSSSPSTPTTPSNGKLESYSGYVTSKINNLAYHTCPSWDDSTIAGYINKGTVLTVVGRQLVDGVYQYKTKAGWFITSATEYVTYSSSISGGSTSTSKPSSGSSSTKYSVGQHVVFSTCYKSSTAPNSQAISASNMTRNHGTITKIVSGAKNPYLLDNGLCWVNDGDIRGLYGGSTSTSTMTARQFALEVWNQGLHGTGATRQAEAKKYGVDYNEVQRLINILASGGKI